MPAWSLSSNYFVRHQPVAEAAEIMHAEEYENILMKRGGGELNPPPRDEQQPGLSANGQSLFLVLPTQVPQRHHGHPLYVQNHPSTGLPGSETGHGCGPVDTGTFGLPLSPTEVTDGRYGYRHLIRLFLFHVESLIASGMAKLPSTCMEEVAERLPAPDGLVISQARSIGGTESTRPLCYTGRPLLDVLAQAARGGLLNVSERSYPEQTGWRSKRISISDFPRGSIAASKAKTNTLAEWRTKRIRTVIGSCRRSEAA
ncbi:hypothetical protein NHJ6243_009371 [Beauveria neobassiana]